MNACLRLAFMVEFRTKHFMLKNDGFGTVLVKPYEYHAQSHWIPLGLGVGVMNDSQLLSCSILVEYVTNTRNPESMN